MPLKLNSQKIKWNSHIIVSPVYILFCLFLYRDIVFLFICIPFCGFCSSIDQRAFAGVRTLSFMKETKTNKSIQSPILALETAIRRCTVWVQPIPYCEFSVCSFPISIPNVRYLLSKVTIAFQWRYAVFLINRNHEAFLSSSYQEKKVQ